LDPFKERLGLYDLFAIVMTAEIQDKAMWSQMHVKS